MVLQRYCNIKATSKIFSNSILEASNNKSIPRINVHNDSSQMIIMLDKIIIHESKIQCFSYVS